MFDFLNQNVGSLTVIFAGVVTLSTVVYAVLTAMLVAETRRMRQVQTEPKMEILLKAREEWINIVRVHVRNIGLGPAYDISFKITAESGGEGFRILIDDFTKAQFLRAGLRYMGPGQELVSGYSQMTEKFDKKIESVLIFDVKYRSATRRSFEESFRIDFSEFKGRSQLGKPHLYAIAQNLEKMQKDFHNIATGFKRIKADIFDSEDRESERQEWEEYEATAITESKKAKGDDS